MGLVLEGRHHWYQGAAHRPLTLSIRTGGTEQRVGERDALHPAIGGAHGLEEGGGDVDQTGWVRGDMAGPDAGSRKDERDVLRLPAGPAVVRLPARLPGRLAADTLLQDGNDIRGVGAVKRLQEVLVGGVSAGR